VGWGLWGAPWTDHLFVKIQTQNLRAGVAVGGALLEHVVEDEVFFFLRLEFLFGEGPRFNLPYDFPVGRFARHFRQKLCFRADFVEDTTKGPDVDFDAPDGARQDFGGGVARRPNPVLEPFVLPRIQNGMTVVRYF